MVSARTSRVRAVSRLASGSGRLGSKLSWVTPNREQLPGHQRGRLAVESVGDDHVVALADQGQQGGGDGRHPRGADQARLGALDLGHLGGELGRVGMAVAGVEEALEPAVVEAVDLIEVGDLVDRRSGRAKGPGDATEEGHELPGHRGRHRAGRHHREVGSAGMAACSFASRHVGRAGVLAVEASGLAQHGDDLAELAEGEPVIVRRAPRRVFLRRLASSVQSTDQACSMAMFPGPLGQLRQTFDQRLVDRAVRRSVAVLLLRSKRRGRLFWPLKIPAQAIPPRGTRRLAVALALGRRVLVRGSRPSRDRPRGRCERSGR